MSTKIMGKKFLAGCIIFCIICQLIGCASSKKNSAIESERRVMEGEYGIAMITDSGNISDMSFNQSVYEACKAYASNHQIYYTAKKPRENSDEGREQMVRLAIEEGYNIIVLPGYSFAKALVACSKDYPEVKFIAMDISEDDIISASRGSGYNADESNDTAWNYISNNCYLMTYKEEQAGFLAGYAAVRMGYRKLGFMGGIEVPAVQRYGYGFIQGIDAAAKELNVCSEVNVKYMYSGTFSPNVEITKECSDWYKQGCEVIFSCGGAIYSAVAEAAYKFDGKLIGVDVDQSDVINSYGEGMALTSATKGLAPSVINALDAILVNDSWNQYAGKLFNLGIVSDNPDNNYVQLAKQTAWTESFDATDYKKLVHDILEGVYVVRVDIDTAPDLIINVDYEP